MLTRDGPHHGCLGSWGERVRATNDITYRGVVLRCVGARITQRRHRGRRASVLPDEPVQEEIPPEADATEQAPPPADEVPAPESSTNRPFISFLTEPTGPTCPTYTFYARIFRQLRLKALQHGHAQYVTLYAIKGHSLPNSLMTCTSRCGNGIEIPC